MRNVRCPYCRYIYNDIDMVDSENELYGICSIEDIAEETCPKCNEKFIVEGGYIPQYKTYRLENNPYEDFF